MKFKKFLRFFVVFLVIVASIGGTCYLFYSNLVLNQNSFSIFNDYVYGSSKTEFDASVDYVYTNLSSDRRFATYILVDGNLNEIAKTLNAYYINFDDSDLSGINVIKKLEELEEIQTEAESKLDEYQLHCTEELFSRTTGANKVFEALYDYLVCYSELLSLVRAEVCENVVTNNNADIKFDVVEIYLNICLDTFSNTTTTNNLLNPTSTTNLDAINNYFEIENGNVVTSGTSGRYLSSYNNSFIKYYRQCDASAYAKSFASNLSQYTSISDTSSALAKAVYYFRQIFGVA